MTYFHGLSPSKNSDSIIIGIRQLFIKAFHDSG